MLDHSKAAVTALSFGRLDSKLLAFGSDDGCLRVADVGSVVSTILHVSREALQQHQITIFCTVALYAAAVLQHESPSLGLVQER